MATIDLGSPPVVEPEASALETVRIVLLLQGGLATLATVEAALWLVLTGPASQMVSVVLTAAGAAATLVLAARVVHGGRAARVLVFVVEWAILAVTMVDLALALLVAHGSIGMMPALTRIVLPITAIGLLARSQRGNVR
jgi:hypothetical protein